MSHRASVKKLALLMLCIWAISTCTGITQWFMESQLAHKATSREGDNIMAVDRSKYSHSNEESAKTPSHRKEHVRVMKQMPSDSSHRKPTCTNELFRHYYQKHSSFPEHGIWVNKSDPNNTRYRPDFCEFRPFDFPECIIRKNWRHVVIMGDSNGVRYFRGLREMALQFNMNCSTQKTDTGSTTADPRYFAENDTKLQQLLRLRTKGCRTCVCELVTCEIAVNGSKPYQLHIEFLSAAHVVESAVSLAPSNGSYPEANHQMEFLFKVYYKRQVPDAFFLFVPITHEKLRFSPEDLPRQVSRVVDLVGTLMPQRSSFYWVPCPAEFPERKKRVDLQTRLFSGLQATDCVYTFNRMLFDSLKTVLTLPTSNQFGFVNMVNMSLPVLDWSIDGVHYEQVWYNNVVYDLFSIACHS